MKKHLHIGLHLTTLFLQRSHSGKASREQATDLNSPSQWTDGTITLAWGSVGLFCSFRVSVATGFMAWLRHEPLHLARPSTPQPTESTHVPALSRADLLVTSWLSEFLHTCFRVMTSTSSHTQNEQRPFQHYFSCEPALVTPGSSVILSSKLLSLPV